MKGPNIHQKRRRFEVEQLIRITQSSGLGSAELGEQVLKLYVWGINEVDAMYAHNSAKAGRVNSAGLMAQLYVLVEAWGAKKTQRWIQEKGNALDAFVKGFSSTPEAREAEIGRDNVDYDGCVIHA